MRTSDGGLSSVICCQELPGAARSRSPSVGSRDERGALEHFRERYGAASTDIETSIEQRVVGGAWGANGYTTVDQANELARRLALEPGKRLLDLGTGRGWPGLYFAVTFGCDVIGSDMPLAALSKARRRADLERVGSRFLAVAAAGPRQPFRDRSFDAVVHTDVLCCLTSKLDLLRTLKKVLVRGGRMAYTTIYVIPGLSTAARRRAHRFGPRAVASRSGHRTLLDSAGFTDIDELDVTTAFVDTQRSWIEQRELHATELAALESPGAFDERQEDRRGQLAATEEGLLGRAIFSARRP